MSVIIAAQAGDWSDTATWTGGVLPTTGDDAQPATFEVTIDQTVTCDLLESIAAGYFTVATAQTINADIKSSVGNTGTGVVRCTHASGTVTINGDLQAGPEPAVSLTGAGDLTVVGSVTAGSSTSSYGLDFTSTGTVTITGDVTGGSGSNAYGINTTSTGTVTITGDVTGGTVASAYGINITSTVTVTITGDVTGGSGSNAYGIYTTSTGTVTITGNVNGGTGGSSAFGINIGGSTVDIIGNVTAGSVSAAYGVSITAGTLTVTGNVTGGGSTNVYGINITSTGTVTITGDATGGSGSNASGIYLNGSGTVTVSGTVTGGSGSSAYGARNNSSGTLRVGTAKGNDYGPLGGHSSSCPGLSASNNAVSVSTYKNLITGDHGQSPVDGAAYLEVAAGATAILNRTDALTTTLTNAADTVDYPGIEDVRNGTVFANATLTGTAYIPGAGSVAFGVNTDATTGTATLTQADVSAAAWSIANMRALADEVLGRSGSNVDGSAATHSLYELIQAILESSTATGDWVIKKTDGATTFNTRTLTTDADALPVTGVS